MRIQLLALVLLANTVIFGQTVKLVAVSPAELKANNSVIAGDNGSREIKVDLELSGRRRTTIVELEIVASGNLSATKLINNKIKLEGIAFPGSKNKKNTLTFPLQLSLPPLTCLTSTETFSIKIKGEPNSIGITIKKFPEIPATFTVALKNDTTIIHPLKEENDNGKRAIIVPVVISGTPPANPYSFKFQIPDNLNSISNPQLVQESLQSIPVELYNENGCPRVIDFPIIITLKKKAIKEYTEYIPILIKDNSSSAHIVVIKDTFAKKAVETTPINPKKDITMNVACRSGKNYSILIKKNNPGGTIEIFEQSSTTSYTYKFSSYYYTSDFSKWVFNIFKPKDPKIDCDECLLCANEIADKVFIELMSSQPAAETKNLSDTKEESKKEEDKKASDSTKKEAKSIVPPKTTSSDSILYKFNFNYNDTALYSVTLLKIKNLTRVKLCPETPKGNCDSTTLVDITKETFTSVVTQMLMKKLGKEELNEKLINPPISVEYDRYQNKLAELKPIDTPAIFKNAYAAIAGLNPAELTESNVGFVELAKDSMVMKYNRYGQEIKKIKIDSVRFYVESGKLIRRKLIVYTSDGIFFNAQSPISLSTFQRRLSDRLYSIVQNDNENIILKDVLRVETDGYVPDDIDNQILTRKNARKNLSAASNLNSLINFSLFTDLTGILGRRANALINTDITGKFITNTRNIRNADLTFFTHLEANFLLSKFDSRYRSVDSTNILEKQQPNQLDTIDRMHMMQVAWFKGSMKFNLASFRLPTNQLMDINIGFRMGATNADSFYRKETDIIFFEYYPEFTYSIKRLKNFGTDLSLRYLIQRIADRESFSNKGVEYIFNPQVSFFYYPTSSINNTVYFRFNYFANRDEKARNFYQLQLGWKTGLKVNKN